MIKVTYLGRACGKCFEAAKSLNGSNEKSLGASFSAGVNWHQFTPAKNLAPSVQKVSRSPNGYMKWVRSPNPISDTQCFGSLCSFHPDP